MQWQARRGSCEAAKNNSPCLQIPVWLQQPRRRHPRRSSKRFTIRHSSGCTSSGLEYPYSSNSPASGLPYGLPAIQTGRSPAAAMDYLAQPLGGAAKELCKAEPESPASGNGAWVPQTDWAAAYDSFMGPLHGGGCGFGADDEHFAATGLAAGGWSAGNGDSFCLSPGDADFFDGPGAGDLQTVRTVPDMAALERECCPPAGAFCQSSGSDADTMVPARPATPASGVKCEGGGGGAAEAASDGSDATQVASCFMRTRRGGSPTASGDSASTPVVLSATQRCAASLMPPISGGCMAGAPQRRCRLSAKPSDAELKEAIAALQKSAARSAPTAGASLCLAFLAVARHKSPFSPHFEQPCVRWLFPTQHHPWRECRSLMLLLADTPRHLPPAGEAHVITRAECLVRYREKKLRRLDVNTIRYMKRKINADRRPRASLHSPIAPAGFHTLCLHWQTKSSALVCFLQCWGVQELACRVADACLQPDRED